MAENYKHLYEQAKKMLTMYQDELIPGYRKHIAELEQNQVEVRCRECKCYEQPDEGDSLGRCLSGRLAVSSNGEIYPEPDYFCPYGERK